MCPEELEKRRLGNKKKAKGHFTTKGPNWVWSLDGHDKLMGYQNSTFPLAIYGCIDTASRKILWLTVWNTNSKPEIIEDPATIESNQYVQNYLTLKYSTNWDAL